MAVSLELGRHDVVTYSATPVQLSGDEFTIYRCPKSEIEDEWMNTSVNWSSSILEY